MTIVPVWAGVDVGGRAKGFHVAMLGGEGVLLGPERVATVAEVVALLRTWSPAVIGVDAPCATAPAGATVREDERALARAVCRIRWTPSREKLDGNPYYGWVLHGLELHAALDDGPWEVLEVFPTASWTVWGGPRGRRPRGAWSAAVLDRFALDGLPPRRLGQDDRDALAAALTAREHAADRTRRFGAIVVPGANLGP